LTFSQLKLILEATGLSPEKLAPVFSVGSMTVRRWLKTPGNKKVPKVDQWNIIESIYKLVLDGKLSTTSGAVQAVLKNSTPGSFQAIAKELGVTDMALSSKDDQQDKMLILLSQIGGDRSHKKQVDEGSQKLTYFKKMGIEWRERISGLVCVIHSSKLSTLEKLVAYGALFYLITPLDLIPDHIPVIGLIDDFGILGFAVAYYFKSYPHYFNLQTNREFKI
jgi:uncharacterized membrane protein YkvA (DUF1232 family)